MPIITCWASTFQVGRRESSSDAFSQPACSAPEHGVPRVEGGVVQGRTAVAVRLVGAVLAGVEHEQLGQPAERGLAVEPHVRARGAATARRSGIIS